MAEPTIKQLLLEKTANDLGQELSLVETIVGWGMKDAFKALKKHDEVEISGFGKYIISQSKLKKRIANNERILGYLNTHPQTEERDRKIKSTTEGLEYYYSKLKQTNENNEEAVQTGVGGVAQPSLAPGTFEGADRNSGEREAGNLAELT